MNEYVHWVSDHADEYNLDRDNVFLIGDSAGGQMAEQYTVVLTNPAYRAKLGYELPNLHFRAVALNSPATFMLDPGMVGGGTAAYFKPDVMADPEKLDLLNVEKYITSDFCQLTSARLMRTSSTTARCGWMAFCGPRAWKWWKSPSGMLTTQSRTSS